MRFTLKRMSLLFVVLFTFSCAEEKSSVIKEEKTLMFSDIEFETREDIVEVSGPGKNYWSSANEGPFVDDNGALHLNILEKNDKWYCSELKSVDSYGYGEYTYQVQGIDQTKFPENVVFGLFLYETDTSEIDIEFSFWDGKQTAFGIYTLQPHKEAGVQRFTFAPEPKNFTCKIRWTPDSVYFTTFYGWTNEPVQPSDTISSRIYKGKHNFEWKGKERLYMNLYLVDFVTTPNPNKFPDGKKEVEVVINKVTFVPLEDL